jgi:hypothetical protein
VFTLYSDVDKEMVKNIREVLDLEHKLKEIQSSSPAVVSQQTMKGFIESADYIDHDLDIKIEKYEMREQYQVFIRKLADLSLKKESEKLSSMSILMIMMNTEGKLYEGCEAVMDILCQAAVKMSVESVVESWISVLEHHSSKTRDLKDETILTELVIAVNGPLVQHCNKVVESTMKTYWKKNKIKSLQDGHFVRKSNRIKPYFVSKAVDNLNSKAVKVPFMM